MIANSTPIVNSARPEPQTARATLNPEPSSRAGSGPDRVNNQRWKAVLARDSLRDGTFVYAVTSTGVFCRPSCPSRRPRRDHVRFFATAAEAERAGFRACFRCQPTQRDRLTLAVEKLCRYIEAHTDESLTLALLGRQAGISPFHLHRAFKKRTGLTPREYAAACRNREVRKGLQTGLPVTQALFAAGYGSTSRLYEHSDKRLGMTPATYGRKGRGAQIRYALADSALGKVLLAATDKGVCSLRFADSERALVSALKEEFALATLTRTQATLRPWLNSVVRYLRGAQTDLALPLDIRSTAFQWRVWKHLQTIPTGSTQSYANVAAALGRPTAPRAVARACASNPVAVVIPCHRVLRRDGGLGGYRWGLKRKKKLLARERRGDPQAN
jgi:AraC family transcriptional regulator of adaptative response/methylated-DNA-[protein]-cysteine methyltransferase